MTDFPASISARKCLLGEGCGDTVYWVLRRTLLVNAALRLAGEKEDRWKKSLYASLAVQAGVFGWAATHLDEPQIMPSAATALGGDAFDIAGTYLTRSIIVGTGLWLAGDQKHLVRNTLISTALMQLSVLMWAAQQETQQS